MIDKTQPPPGWDEWWCGDIGKPSQCYLRTGMMSVEDAHARYAEHSRPAVLEFAEHVAAWLQSPAFLSEADSTPEGDEPSWLAEQILAAARGERTLP